MCHIYHEVLDRHLRQHDFKSSDADPCLYTKLGSAGCTTAAITIYDFLVMAPTDALLDDLTTILEMI